jgi:cytochrome c-type biogenesis protein CcmH/NrfG
MTMLATLGILSLAMALVSVAIWRLLRTIGVPTPQSTIIGGIALWVTASVVVALSYEETPRESPARTELVQSLDSLAWPEPSSAAPPSARATSAAAGVQAASVESLVSGLEARLAAQPNDAQGWALLAQSYAFTSNEEAVERAVQRAVALGFDEGSLRERVAGAQRSAPAVDWVDRAISVPRL